MMISRNEWKEFADIVFTKDPDLPQVPLIAGQLKQVILNLLVNAAHAIAAKSTTNSQEKGVITIHTTYDIESVHIHLQDSGTGIPDGILEKIFDPPQKRLVKVLDRDCQQHLKL